MDILRTPDHCFENLQGYPFDANYLEVDDGLRMHYIDAGPRDGQIVLLLHGEPSWSYLYRKMIPIFVNNGYRALAPDLIGFGKSDKLTDLKDYTFAAHMEWMHSWLEQMNLNNIILFCQDWGGLIGLRLVADQADKFAGVVAANTALPTGHQPMPEAFEKWKTFSQTVPEFPAAGVVSRGTVSDLSPEVLKAYDAPYPEEKYKAGARIFPALVPASTEDPESEKLVEAWKALAQFDKPFLTLFSDSDPIMRGGEKVFQKMIPGAKGQPHEIIEAGGHFLQEDKGEEIAQKVVAWLAS